MHGCWGSGLGTVGNVGNDIFLKMAGFPQTTPKN